MPLISSPEFKEDDALVSRQKVDVVPALVSHHRCETLAHQAVPTRTN
jgi:hypothetical protein